MASTTKSKSALEQSLHGQGEKRSSAGDEMPPGVMKMVKVFVAVKRKMQSGRGGPQGWGAGRHGNKGCRFPHRPDEDMPFLDDGTHVDIVLNPLGRAVAHECGPDPGDASWLACGKHEAANRRTDRRVQGIRRHQAGPARSYEAIIPDNDRNEPVRDSTTSRLFASASNCVAGVSIATPVFDGANEGRQLTRRSKWLVCPPPDR